MVGAYGVGEVLSRLETGFATKPLDKISQCAHRTADAAKELNDIKGMFLRSSVVGNLIGMLPGAGATIASFVSYGVEAQLRQPQEPDGHRHRRRHRRAAGGGHRLGRRRDGAICSRSAFPAAARPPSFSAPSCCTASSRGRRCS